MYGAKKIEWQGLQKVSADVDFIFCGINDLENARPKTACLFIEFREVYHVSVNLHAGWVRNNLDLWPIYSIRRRTGLDYNAQFIGIQEDQGSDRENADAVDENFHQDWIKRSSAFV